MAGSGDWDAEKGVRRFRQQLLDVADARLGAEHLTKSDADMLRHARSDIGFFEPLMGLLNREDEAEATALGHECLWRLMRAAYLIGTHGVIPPSAENYLRAPIAFETKAERAAHARQERAEGSEEQTLLAAILAERGPGPVLQPWKEAYAIRGAVNRQLAASGHEVVEVDVIYRRLLKFPRS
jgi:hypothetical protein